MVTNYQGVSAGRRSLTPVPQRMTAARRQVLEEALIKVSEDWSLSWINAADYKKLGVIEGCAHEIAHVLDLGLAFEDLLQAMPAEESNAHEASVLRIEVAALAALGVHLSMRRLRGSANWDGSVDGSGAPTLKQLQEALLPHERDCVLSFVDLVINEIRRQA